MRSSSEEGSYLRLVDFCITQLYAKSNKEEKKKKVHLQPARERNGLEAQGGVARELGRRARRVRVLVRHTLTRGSVISPRSALLLRLTRVHWLFSCRHAGFAIRMERESAHTHQIGGRK